MNDFFTKTAVPASKLPGEVSTMLSFNPVLRIRKQVPKKSFVLLSATAEPTMQKSTITVPVKQHCQSTTKTVKLPVRGRKFNSLLHSPQSL